MVVYELVVIFFGVLIPVLVGYFIYQYGKNRGRLQEMKRQLKEREEGR